MNPFITILVGKCCFPRGLRKSHVEKERPKKGKKPSARQTAFKYYCAILLSFKVMLLFL